MSKATPVGYDGIDLPESVLTLIQILGRYGFAVAATTRFAGKTINLMHNGSRCGYINSTVLAKGAILGYHFTWSGRPNNACPPEIADRLLEEFSKRYRCDPDDLEIHHGTGSNAGRTNLHIRNATLALRVLLQDIGQSLDDSVTLAKINARYVEGAVRDVSMQSYERSANARLACLGHYGYDCVVCGKNLRRQYRGLQVELIHVHHEHPFAQEAGQRETDPLLDLKPVCPNCHGVIHSRSPAYSIEDVRTMLHDASCVDGQSAQSVDL
jgi:hypothetical protein